MGRTRKNPRCESRVFLSGETPVASAGSGAAHVGAVFGADADDFAFLDEERNADHEAGLEGGGLLDVGGGVALHAVGALGDLEVHGGGKLDGEGLLVDEEHVHFAVGGEVVLGVADEGGGELDLLEGLGIDEREVFAVGVAELEGLLLGREHLDRVGGRETLVERLAVAQIAHLHLHERAEVARRAVHGFHDEVGLAVEFDDLAFANVVGGGHDWLRRRGFRVVEKVGE